MKRQTPIWFSLCSVAAAAFLPMVVSAQQPPSKPAPKPPVLEKLEEGQAPDAVIPPKPSGTKMTPQRNNQGKTTAVEVQSGNSNYVVKSNDQPGSIQPGEAQSTATRVPQWKVMEFELGAKKDKKATEPTPAPPAAPAAKK